MPGPEFFQTKMGQRYYEVTLPRIAEELANLVKAVNAVVVILKERLPAPQAQADRPPHD